MRRMCRGAQTRYIKIRLRKSRVNSLSRFSRLRPSHQKASHRAIAQSCRAQASSMPEGPARRPGRSEAKSIDDAEHGASLKDAMVRRQDLDPRTRCSSRENMRRARTDFCSTRRPHCSGKCGHEDVHVDGAIALHELCAQTATCDTTNDGVNDPVSTLWGHSTGRTPGSFTPSSVHRLQHQHRR